MKTIKQISLVIAVFLFSAISVSAVEYEFKHIELPGYTYTYRGYYANDVNDHGVIVGGMHLGAGYHDGFVLDGDTYMKYTDSARDSGESINNNGDIVFLTRFSSGQTVGILQTADGTVYDISKATPETNATTPLGVNDQGVVVGNYDKSGPNKGFTFQNDVYTLMPEPDGAYNVMAYDINNSGVIVGGISFASNTSRSYGFIYRDGEFEILDYPGSTYTFCTGINDNLIVGQMQVDGAYNGFIYDMRTQEYTEFLFPGAERTAPGGISNNGKIVGSYWLNGQRLAFLAEPKYTLEDGLVAYYPFNDNAADESGNGNDGEVFGAVSTTDRFGNSDSAFSFNGSEYIAFGSNPVFGQSKGPFSISCWVKPGATDNGVIIFLGTDIYGSLTNEENFAIQTFADGLRVWIGDTFNQPGNTAALEYQSNLDTWYHMTAIVNDQSIQLYVDGSYIGTQNSTFELTSDGWDAMRFGASTWGSSARAFFTGSLDDIRIYNRALSAIEIQELYSQEAPPIEPPTCEAPVDTDLDGVIDDLDICPDTPQGSAVYNTGCVADDLYTQSQVDQMIAQVAADKQVIIDELADALAEKEQLLNDQQELNQQLQTTNAELNQTIIEKNQVISDKQLEIDSLTAQLVELNSQIAALTVVNENLSQQVDELNLQVTEKDQEISELNSTLAEKDQVIADLQAAIATMFTQEQVDEKIAEACPGNSENSRYQKFVKKVRNYWKKYINKAKKNKDN